MEEKLSNLVAGLSEEEDQEAARLIGQMFSNGRFDVTSENPKIAELLNLIRGLEKDRLAALIKVLEI